MLYAKIVADAQPGRRAGRIIGIEGGHVYLGKRLLGGGTGAGYVSLYRAANRIEADVEKRDVVYQVLIEGDRAGVAILGRQNIRVLGRILQIFHAWIGEHGRPSDGRRAAGSGGPQAGGAGGKIAARAGGDRKAV